MEPLDFNTSLSTNVLSHFYSDSSLGVSYLPLVSAVLRVLAAPNFPTRPGHMSLFHLPCLLFWWVKSRQETCFTSLTPPTLSLRSSL